VAGKGLAALVASLVIMLVVLAVGVVGFDLALDAPAQLALALLCSSFSAAGLILLFASLGRTAQAVEGACWTVMIPLFMAGGGMMPLVFMPDWLQTVSHFSPLKWNLYAVEGAVWRDFSLTEMALPCGILIAIGLVAFVVGGTLLSRARA
jgi:ABC-2 type transport system permease protein